MLVLSRKKDESIVINNDITIVVVEIRGDKVRLGVEAPKEVPVHRREVFDAIAGLEVTVNEIDSAEPATADVGSGSATAPVSLPATAAQPTPQAFDENAGGTAAAQGQSLPRPR